MVDFLVKRPVATIMSFIAFILMGIVASQRIPVSLLPDIDIPEITIHINRENTSLHTLENSVVTPFRKQLLQVSGVKDIQSETKNNQAVIRLLFEFGVDIDYAFLEVNDKIDAVMAYMPKDVQRPRIIKASATDIPVFYLNISEEVKRSSSLSSFQLSEFVNHVIKKRIEQLPEVALADVTGIVSPEIYIIPDEDKFRNVNLTLSDLQDAFVQNNLNPGSILIQDGHYQYNLMFDNELKSVDDISNILINKGGRVLRLGELAEIGTRTRERKGMYLNGRTESVNLAVIKHSSAKMNKMKEEVNKVLEQFQKDYPELNFDISRDQTQLLNYSINNLKQSLVIGCALAVLIMFLFIRNPRAPLLIAFSIPVSLVISLLFFYIIGLSVNIISLSGLILGVGMMIDNSIIVIDNIAQYNKKGESLLNAIVIGTNEVIRPLISSVLTTCAVFIPLIFLSGISGALFYDQAMAVTIGLFVSLIVSLTILPVLYKLFHINYNEKSKSHFVLFDLENYYNKWFDFVFSYRRIIILGFFIFIFLGVFFIFILDKKQMPDIRQTEMVVNIDWNENLSLDNNKERVNQLINSCNNILESNSYLGVQQFLLNQSLDMDINECQIYIKAETQEDIEIIQQNLYSVIQHNFPQAKVEFAPPENIFQRIFSGKSNALLVAEVSSLKGEVVPPQPVMDSLYARIINDIPVRVSNIPKQQNIHLKINQTKLLTYDIRLEDLQTAIRNAFNKNQVGQIIHQKDFVPVVTGQNGASVYQSLENTFVHNKQGDKIPVTALLKMDKVEDYKSIVSNENGAYIPILISAEDHAVRKNIQRIQSTIDKFPNLHVNFSGSWFETQKLVKEMSVVLIISLLLLYFILAAQFESLLQPLIVLIEVPIDIGGALLFLYIFNTSINILSLIGIIVMTGIIINDSILKIDTINRLKRSGYPLIEAIHKGGTRRLKPIIMTSLTTILALVPFLFGSDIGSELQYPLAVAVIGGLGLGTIVSLFFIPLMYYYLYKLKSVKVIR
ncbi:MAG: efflux RND transporter permease subunit [Thiohalospira sp.]